MRCRRAFEADLAAVLHGAGTDADFQAHYPGCPECAAEVAVWRELDATLRAGTPTGDDHPDEAELLAFVDVPASLAASARGAIERHLAACRVCADEARTLQRTDLGRLLGASEQDGAAARTTAAPRSTVASRSDDGTPGWFRRVVWHPAFAYALVAVLLVPVVRHQLIRFDSDRAGADRQVAETKVEARRDAPAPPASHDAAGPRDQLAAAPPAAADSAAKAASEGSGLTASSSGRTASTREERPNRDAGPPREPAQQAMRKMAPNVQPQAESGAAVVARRRDPAPPPPPAAPAAREADHAMLRQFGDTLGRAAGAAPPASESVVEIGPERSAIVPLAVAAGGPRLRVVLPPGADDGPVDVRVRARAGGGEIFQRVAVRANAIELQIPPNWLAVGDYVLTVGPAVAAPAGQAARGGRTGAATVIGFTVRAPRADDDGH